MERSVDRLEQEKQQLESIVSAVEKVSAAEKAANSAGLPPLHLTSEIVLLDSEDESSKDQPPAYETLI